MVLLERHSSHHSWSNLLESAHHRYLSGLLVPTLHATVPNQVGFSRENFPVMLHMAGYRGSSLWPQSEGLYFHSCGNTGFHLETCFLPCWPMTQCEGRLGKAGSIHLLKSNLWCLAECFSLRFCLSLVVGTGSAGSACLHLCHCISFTHYHF
jgi:hypothetical protein